MVEGCCWGGGEGQEGVRVESDLLFLFLVCIL